MILAALAIILLVKPLVALLIVALLGHSARTALTVALGLAQIGEFSFILSELARKHGLMPDDGHNVLVAAAILSITLNPLLFRSLDRDRALAAAPSAAVGPAQRPGRAAGAARPMRTWRSRSAGTPRRGSASRWSSASARWAGRCDRLLRDAGLTTVVIDMNMDTVAELKRQGQAADLRRRVARGHPGAGGRGPRVAPGADPAALGGPRRRSSPRRGT